MGTPRPSWPDDTCAVCPAQRLGAGDFDVVARPGHHLPYRPELGYRADDHGTPVCAHPFRVGMPVGAYKSAGAPVPDAGAPMSVPCQEDPPLPEQLEDLEGWLVAMVRSVPPEQMFGAITRAEREAGERFASRDIVKALRRVMSRELTWT